jgi:hypothetical protein
MIDSDVDVALAGTMGGSVGFYGGTALVLGYDSIGLDRNKSGQAREEFEYGLQCGLGGGLGLLKGPVPLPCESAHQVLENLL